MIIWFALLIPLITVPVLLYFFPRRIVWWELGIPLAASLIIIGICKYGTEAVQTRDIEYWGGWLTHAEYYEAWDEEVSCCHPVYRTDSKGNSVFEGYQHSYDVDYHSPYWLARDSNGISQSISREHFERLAVKFNSRIFVDLHRSYHSMDGDKYVARWNGQEETFTPFASTHTYENRVQASNSLFNFPDVDPKENGLFEYPEIQGAYACAHILGQGGPTMVVAERKLSAFNARVAASKQVWVWILVFNNKPFQTGIAQQNYWKNGNKNELVVNIGVDSQFNVQWCHVFSWTDVEKLKIDTRSQVLEQQGKPLDLVKIADWLEPEIRQSWVRKQFAEFSYLTVEPPGWMVALTYFLTLVVSLGASAWVIYNDFSPEN